MGSAESTTRKVSFGVDEEDRVRILRGIKVMLPPLAPPACSQDQPLELLFPFISFSSDWILNCNYIMERARLFDCAWCEWMCMHEPSLLLWSSTWCQTWALYMCLHLFLEPCLYDLDYRLGLTGKYVIWVGRDVNVCVELVSMCMLS